MNKTILTLLACTALGAGTVSAQQTNTMPATPDARMAPAAGPKDSSSSYTAPAPRTGTTDVQSSGSLRSGGVAPSTMETDKKGNAAINTNKGESRTAAAPVAGRNSFTAGEARSRIEKHGYANVTGLKKDANGVWRGMATKNGANGDVALDYQGNIVMDKQ